jgi:hypothetical protein
MIVSGTGTRKVHTLPEHSRESLITLVQQELTALQPSHVLSGGAQGFDTILAVAAYRLGIPYRLLLPNPGYVDYYWNRKSLTGSDDTPFYHWLATNAESVAYDSMQLYVVRDGVRIHSNFARNQGLVDNSDHMIVLKVADRITGGTTDCWKRIHAANRDFTVIDFRG